MPNSRKIVVDSVRKGHSLQGGGTELVFSSLSLEIEASEFLTLFGPNGCGKTTLLDLLAGISSPDAGVIAHGDEARHTPAVPNVGYIFQDYRQSLFPWRTIEQNIALPLQIRHRSRRQSREMVHQFLERFEVVLPLEKYPYQLSGGQQQLACICRALVSEPTLVLFDEPFSSLDYATRVEMHKKVEVFKQHLQFTAVFVSHDLDEAILLADRVAILGPKPRGIRATRSVALRRPRSPDLLTSDEFLVLRRELGATFHAEVLSVQRCSLL